MRRATATEILQRYAAGERNFQHLDLQGADLQNANLAAADFSECDLRGTSFSRANLTGASFRGAQTGVPPHWAIALAVAAILLAGACAFVAALFAAVLSFFIFDANSTASQTERIAYGCVISATYLTFAIVSTRKSIAAAFGALLLAGTAALLGTIAGAGAGTGAGAVAVAIAVAATGAGAVAIAIIIAGSAAGTTAAAIAGAVALAGALSVAAGGATAIDLLGKGAAIGAVAGAFPMTLLGTYLGWRTLKGDPRNPCRDPWFRNFALSIPAACGTSFFQANLTDADLSDAFLKNAYFRKALLHHAKFFGARKLHLACAGRTYLRHLSILTLLVTGAPPINKTALNFNRLNLRGIDLSNLDLTDASFIATNLNAANLSGSNLSRAKLARTQLDRTDLRGTILTSATIEDWNVTINTHLDAVHCDYIFLRLSPDRRPAFFAPSAPNDNPQDSNRQRKPEDWSRNFAPGEFAALFAPRPPTLDLYHARVGDLHAITLALQKLRDDNPSAKIEPSAFEFSGSGTHDVLVRVKIAPTADAASLHDRYFQTYDTLKNLPTPKLQSLVANGGARSRQLLALLSTAVAAPKHNLDSNATGIGKPTNSANP